MAATLKPSDRGLEAVDRARRHKGWLKSSPEWCQAANTSRATLKRFWRKLPVRSQTFAAICAAVGVPWETVAESGDEIDPTSSPSDAPASIPSDIPDAPTAVDFFAYDAAWVGRDALVADLTQSLHQSTRLLLLLGITGIGKTALAERLAVALYPHWTGDRWQTLLRENLENDRQPNDFASVATRWWQQWGEPADDCKDADVLVRRTANRFLETPHLLVLDSLELILVGNEADGWSDFRDPLWAQFFEDLLAAPTCQSRILLTSQDFPGQLPARYSNFWRSQYVTGLSPTEQLALFENALPERSLSDSAARDRDRTYLTRIGAAYEGHPLALRVIAGEIANLPFHGNASAYWHRYGKEIEEVEAAIAQAQQGETASARDRWQLHQCTRHLRLKVRDRLERTFARLCHEARNAYLLLCEASVYRCPVLESFWLSHLEDWDCPEGDRQLALDTLRDRYLVEEIADGDRLLLRQHNLIRSVALKHLQALDAEDHGDCPPPA